MVGFFSSLKKRNRVQTIRLKKLWSYVVSVDWKTHKFCLWSQLVIIHRSGDE